MDSLLKDLTQFGDKAGSLGALVSPRWDLWLSFQHGIYFPPQIIVVTLIPAQNKVLNNA